MLLGTLGASLLGTILARKGTGRAGSVRCSLNSSTSYENKKGREIVRACYTNVLWEWTRFNGVCSRNNLPQKIKDGAYVINLDELTDLGKYWIILFCNKSETVYFDSFVVEHVFEEIKEFVGNKNVIVNIFQVQANNSIMCGYICIGFIGIMLAGQKLIDFMSMFSPCDFKKSDNIILLSYLKDE